MELPMLGKKKKKKVLSYWIYARLLDSDFTSLFLFLAQSPSLYNVWLCLLLPPPHFPIHSFLSAVSCSYLGTYSKCPFELIYQAFSYPAESYFWMIHLVTWGTFLMFFKYPAGQRAFVEWLWGFSHSSFLGFVVRSATPNLDYRHLFSC